MPKTLMIDAEDLRTYLKQQVTSLSGQEKLMWDKCKAAQKADDIEAAQHYKVKAEKYRAEKESFQKIGRFVQERSVAVEV